MGPAGSRSSASLGWQPELQGPTAHRPLLWGAQQGLPGIAGTPSRLPTRGVCDPIKQTFTGA